MNRRTPRKNRYTVKEVLPNGQLLAVFFFRRRVNYRKLKVKPRWPDTKIAHCWSVAIYIGDSNKSARRWIDQPYKTRIKRVKQNGTCGLTGLRRALEHVIDFCEKMKENEELEVFCDDRKRFRAYKWLMRFNGFYDFGSFYAFRHPEWWFWQPNQSANSK